MKSRDGVYKIQDTGSTWVSMWTRREVDLYAIENSQDFTGYGQRTVPCVQLVCSVFQVLHCSPFGAINLQLCWESATTIRANIRRYCDIIGKSDLIGQQIL